MRAAIVDAGPLVAFLDEAERHHRWVVDRVADLDAPLLVCEPVLTEAMHLLAKFSRAQDSLFGLLESGALTVGLRMQEHILELHKLHRKYRDTPMSLADACIVRMSEVHDRHAVVTFDSHFMVYRKHGRVPLTLIYPGET
jgi:predicted nucleic acid-binding protein